MPQHETSTGAANEADRSAFGLVVAGLATGQILAWAVLYYGFASFVLPMMGDLGWAKATLMGAFTLALLVWSLVNYAVGAAIDRGHGRAVLTGGALLGALGCAGWAMAQAPWMLYAAMILVGTAAAMTLYDPAFAVLAKRYPTRYREAITWLTLVAGFASTLSFPAAAALIHGLGWRAALLVLAGVLGLVVAPLHAWLLRDGAATPPPRLGCQAGGLSLHAALRTPAFRRLGVAFTVLAFIGPGLWAHMLPVLQAKGLSDAQAVSVLVWIGPAQVLGRFAYAWLGRGLSLQRLGMMVTVAMPLALLLLAIGGSMASLLLFAAVFGLANGLSTIVRGSLVPACFGHANVGRIGGVMATLSLSAQAAAPLAIAGLLLALGGYVPVLLLLAALGTVGAIAFARLDPPGRRSS
ncbi:MAG: MFS transporter [Burkholderiales bacterium]|nr:MFS transporter [Burkholderiales bacterium]